MGGVTVTTHIKLIFLNALPIVQTINTYNPKKKIEYVERYFCLFLKTKVEIYKIMEVQEVSMEVQVQEVSVPWFTRPYKNTDANLGHNYWASRVYPSGPQLCVGG